MNDRGCKNRRVQVRNETKVDNHPFKLKKLPYKNLLRIVFNLFLQSQKTGMPLKAPAKKAER
jgi:hypothetical protein